MFHSVKSVIFTKLDSCTSQNRVAIAYKIDTGSDWNLMPFQICKMLFLRSTMADLNATIDRSILLKTYNQSNIEQLSRCSVKIRHYDKCVNCRFFVVTCNGSALLEIPYIELSSIIRVMCETIGNKANSWQCDAQHRLAADSQNCSTNRVLQTELDADNAIGDKIHIWLS